MGSGGCGAGAGANDLSYLRNRPPADPKGPLFSDIHFVLRSLKCFLKVPLAPIFTNFEGEARAKKPQLFGQSFPKRG